MIVETLVELFIIIWLAPIAVRFGANIYKNLNTMGTGYYCYYYPYGA